MVCFDKKCTTKRDVPGFIYFVARSSQTSKEGRARAKKFGDYLKWEDADSKSSFYLSVPIYSKKDNKPTGMTRMIFDRKEVPIEFQDLLEDNN